MPQHTRDLGYQANRLARLLRTSMAHELDTVGVTPRQAAVLLQLAAADSLSMGELATRMEIDRPTLTGVVERLERDGWVEYAVNPKDRRSRLVALAPHANSLLPRLREASRRAATPALEALDAEGVDRLLALMQRASDALESHLASEND